MRSVFAHISGPCPRSSASCTAPSRSRSCRWAGPPAAHTGPRAANSWFKIFLLSLNIFSNVISQFQLKNIFACFRKFPSQQRRRHGAASVAASWRHTEPGQSDLKILCTASHHSLIFPKNIKYLIHCSLSTRVIRDRDILFSKHVIHPVDMEFSEWM